MKGFVTACDVRSGLVNVDVQGQTERQYIPQHAPEATVTIQLSGGMTDDDLRALQNGSVEIVPDVDRDAWLAEWLQPPDEVRGDAGEYKPLSKSAFAARERQLAVEDAEYRERCWGIACAAIWLAAVCACLWYFVPGWIERWA